LRLKPWYFFGLFEIEPGVFKTQTRCFVVLFEIETGVFEAQTGVLLCCLRLKQVCLRLKPGVFFVLFEIETGVFETQTLIEETSSFAIFQSCSVLPVVASWATWATWAMSTSLLLLLAIWKFATMAPKPILSSLS
jgi:hypothetical protein